MDAIRLPIQPTGAQLSEHVAALDLLAARLDALASRQAWPALVPFNSKASFPGSIINTNSVKIATGPDSWAEMPPAHAAEYDHARMTEGQAPNAAQPPLPPHRSLKTKDVRFSPVLRRPEDNPAQPVAQQVAEQQPKEGQFALRGPNGEEQEVPASLRSLVDLVGEHLADKLHLPGDETVNEEGLPIHEIRETPDGQLIGSEPMGDGDGEETIPEKEDDYWTPEAAARREALKRRVFGSMSDSDTEDEDDSMDVEPAAAESAPAQEAANGLVPPIGRPSTPPNDPSPINEPLYAQPAHRSPGKQPKGILKAPSRKKSVTFDSSVPLPPDSPPAKPGQERISIAQKPVPILNVPTPGKRAFGGLKSGFLQSANAAAERDKAAAAPTQSNLAPSPSATKPNFASRGVVEHAPVPPQPQEPPPASKIQEIGSDDDEDDSMDVDEDKPKKSLFAQRRAGAKPDFPSIGSQKPMPTMRNSIVERAPLPPSVGELPKSSTSAAPADRTPLVVVDNDSDTDEYGDLGEFDDDEEDEYALDEALLQREAALALHRSLQRQRPIDEDEIDPEAEGDGNVYMAVPRVSTIQGGEGDEPLRIINPTADDLGQFLRVGREEDGGLVFEPPTVHEDSESDGEEEGQDAEDRRQRRKRRRDVMDQLRAGVYNPDEPVRDPTKVMRDYEGSLPPSVQSQPEPQPMQDVVERQPAPSVASGGVVERPPAVGGVTERAPPAPKPKPSAIGGVVERNTDTAAPEPPQPPKKVSRFKAARQGM
ncbi:nuclear envelope-endoplasmic reticulum network protein [Trichosporon asahii var. asahii CBS 8904]|uniref:Nuclear envelope-endoplasmic reticulum network protein n=1 Tax=Trichosporon asahii var. asahii (strain CBS 8904) TaxID=1220162 RepID=K1VCU2_TRIAC|nr:nuclear envelope-endoplasmic reticulum network protein [Trichosporon asahii var. asahii CBS 8904]